MLVFVFFNDTATHVIYTYHHTLSLHDALPILLAGAALRGAQLVGVEIYNALNQRTGKIIFPRFDNADLTGCDLRGAVIEGVDFASTVLDTVNIDGTELRQCTGMRSGRRACIRPEPRPARVGGPGQLGRE